MAFPHVLPMRQRSELIYRSLKGRLAEVLPAAMQTAEIDAWLIVCQEDHLDPIFTTMIPMDTWCPILQILLFIDHGDGKIEGFNISGTNTHDLYTRSYAGQLVEEQWRILRELLAEHDPQRIGVNTGAVQWAAGGLTLNLYRQLQERLPAQIVERFVSAERAAIHWATTLTDDDLLHYEHVCQVAHQVIAGCYSRAVIVPGVTTLDDLMWAYWQRCTDLGFTQAFKPSFRLIRSSEAVARHGADDRVIRPGDFIHCDVGFQYLRLNSDHQQIAYVRRPGETDAPEGFLALLNEAHRLQHIYMASFETGLSGDELLAKVLAAARKAGIPGPKVYSHSVGYFLHEPGPLIGLPWEQEANPGRGDVRLIPNSCFTMELSVEGFVPEWNEPVRLPLEEIVHFDGAACRPLDGRQERFHVV